MRKSFLSISGISLVSRASGYLRDVLLAITFGLGIESAIFLLAFEIPNLLSNLFVEGPFSKIFIPLLGKNFAEDKKKAALKLLNQVCSIFLPLGILATILIFFSLPLLLKSLAPGYYFPEKVASLSPQEVQRIEIPLENRNSLYVQSTGKVSLKNSKNLEIPLSSDEIEVFDLAQKSSFSATLVSQSLEEVTIRFSFYPPGTFEKIVLLSRVMILSLCFAFLINCATAILNLEGKFLQSQSPFLIVNFLSIFTLLFFSKSQDILWILAWCFTLGYAIHALVVIIQCRSLGFRLSLSKPRFSKEIRTLGRDLSIFSLSPLLSYVGIFFVTSFASLFGVVSHRYYLFRIINFPISLIFVPYSVILFPRISKLIHQSGKKSIEKEVVQALNWILLFLVPGVFGLLIFSDAIVKNLFEYGKFTSLDTARLSYFIRIASPALVFMALNHFFIMILSAFREFKYIVKYEFLLLLGRLAFLFLGVKWIGVNAIFLLLPLFYCLDSFVFGNKVNKIIHLGKAWRWENLFKILLSSFGMSFILIFYRKSVSMNIPSLFFGLLIGVASYFFLLLLLRLRWKEGFLLKKTD